MGLRGAFCISLALRAQASLAAKQQRDSLIRIARAAARQVSKTCRPHVAATRGDNFHCDPLVGHGGWRRVAVPTSRNIAAASAATRVTPAS